RRTDELAVARHHDGRVGGLADEAELVDRKDGFGKILEESMVGLEPGLDVAQQTASAVGGSGDERDERRPTVEHGPHGGDGCQRAFAAAARHGMCEQAAATNGPLNLRDDLEMI